MPRSSITSFVTLFSLLLGLADVSRAEEAAPDWPVGIRALARLDLLPQLRRSIEVGSVSSYDRTGGNDDGFSGKYSSIDEIDGSQVIARLEGPGVVYRIWTPTPTDDWMEFYFDGEKEPRLRVRFRELFRGGQPPFLAPLVGYGAGGFYSYVPLPYRTSCEIRICSERVQFYQINFARYPDKAPVETWTPEASRDQALEREEAAKLFASAGSDISKHVAPAGADLQVQQQQTRLPAGQSATLFETHQGGRLAALRIGPASTLAGKSRDLVLRAVWDDEEEPAILCPVGDFFGFAWGQPAMKSLLVGADKDECYCYFPMPFERHAKIEIISQRAVGPPVDIHSTVVFAAAPKTAHEGKFYARWHRENPTQKGVPFTFLDAQGRGHLVGCIQQAQGMVSGNTYFFEGDDQTTIDGDLAIHGTGSEDFYNGGWYDVPGRWEKQLSFPLSGCLGYWKHLGRTGGYRLLLGDAYAFEESILQTIEHAPTNNDLATDYCGVTFVYLQSTPSWSQSLPPVAARRVVDFKKIVFTPSWYVPIHAFTFRNAQLSKKDEEIAGEKVSFLSMTAEGQDWFGSPFISLICDIPASGKYRVSVEAVHGPAQAMIQLFENEAPVGAAVDFYAAERQKSKLTELGEMQLDEGPVHLMFKLTGKNQQATGLGFDLVTIQCERVD
jgi:hypothetical protein